MNTNLLHKVEGKDIEFKKKRSKSKSSWSDSVQETKGSSKANLSLENGSVWLVSPIQNKKKSSNDTDCVNLPLKPNGEVIKVKNRKRKHKEIETSGSDGEDKLKNNKNANKMNMAKKGKNDDSLLKPTKKFKKEIPNSFPIENVAPKSSKEKSKYKLAIPSSPKLHKRFEENVKRIKSPKKKALPAISQEKECFVKKIKSVIQINTVESRTELGIDVKKARKLKKNLGKSAKRNLSEETTGSTESKGSDSKKKRKHKKKAEQTSAGGVKENTSSCTLVSGEDQKKKRVRKKKRSQNSERETSNDMKNGSKHTSSDIKKSRDESILMSTDLNITKDASLKANEKPNISYCSPASDKDQEKKKGKKSRKWKREGATSNDIKNGRKDTSSDMKRKIRDESMSTGLNIIDDASLKVNKKPKIERPIKSLTHKSFKKNTKSELAVPSSPNMHKVLEGKVKKHSRKIKKVLQTVSQEEEKFCVKDLKSVFQINTVESHTELGIDLKKAKKLKKKMRKSAERNTSSNETSDLSESKKKAKRNSVSSEEPQKKVRRANKIKVTSSLAKNKVDAMFRGKKEKRGGIPSIDMKKKREETILSNKKNRDEAMLSVNLKRSADVKSHDKKRKRRDKFTSSDMKNREEPKENEKKRKIYNETSLSDVNIKETSLEKNVWKSKKIPDSRRSFSPKVKSVVKDTSIENSLGEKLLPKKLKKNKIIMKEEVNNLETNEKKKNKTKKHIKEVIEAQTSSNKKEIETSDDEENIDKNIKKRNRRRRTSATKKRSNNSISIIENEKHDVQFNSRFSNDNVLHETSQSDSDIIIEAEEIPNSVNNKMSQKEKDSDIDEASGSDSDIVECDLGRSMFTKKETNDYHQFQLKEIKENNLRRAKAILSDMNNVDEKEMPVKYKKSCLYKSSKNTKPESQSIKTDITQELYNKMAHLPQTDERDDSKQHMRVIDLEDPPYGSDDDNDLVVIFDTIKKDTGCLSDSVIVKKELSCDDANNIEVQKPTKKYISLPNNSSELFVNAIFNVYKKSPDDPDIFYDGTKNPVKSLMKQRAEEAAKFKSNNTNNWSLNSNINSQNEAIDELTEIEIIDQTEVNVDNNKISNETGNHESNEDSNDDEIQIDDNQLKIDIDISEEEMCPSDTESRSNEEKECTIVNGIGEENCHLNEEMCNMDNRDKSILEIEDFNHSFNAAEKGKVSFSNKVSNMEKTKLSLMKETACKIGLDFPSSQDNSHEIPAVNKAPSNSEWETTSEYSQSEISNLGKESGELKSTSVSVYSDEVNTSSGTGKLNNSSKSLLQNEIEANGEVSEEDIWVDELTLKMDESLNDSPSTVSRNIVKPLPELSHRKVLQFDDAADGKVAEINDKEIVCEDSSVMNGSISEASPLGSNSQNIKIVLNENKENIVNNKQEEDLDTSSVATEKESNQETNCLFKSLKQRSTPRSASKIKSKRSSLDKSNSSITLTPLKVSNAALANEIIISPQVSDEEYAASVLNGETDNDSLPQFISDNLLSKSNIEEEKENKENIIDHKKKGDSDADSVTVMVPKESEEEANSSFKSLKQMSTPRSPSSRRSKRTSLEKLDSSITLTPLKVSNAALANEIIISPQVSDEDKAPSALNSEMEDVEKESSSSPSIRRSSRLSISSRKPSSNETLKEEESTSKEDVTSKEDLASDDQSEERDKVLSPMKGRYSLRRLRNPVTPEKPTVTTPRQRRSSLSSIISEESETKLPASPVRPRSRRNSLGGCLTPVRRSRRISGLPEQIEEEK